MSTDQSLEGDGKMQRPSGQAGNEGPESARVSRGSLIESRNPLLEVWENEWRSTRKGRRRWSAERGNGK